MRTCKRCEEPTHEAELGLLRVMSQAPTSMRGFELALCVPCLAWLEVLPDSEVWHEIFVLHEKKLPALEAQA